MSGAVEAEALQQRDTVGARLGMWLFLFTELLLFGGLFLLYAVYRSSFAEDFHYAATTLDPLVGTVNTVILLTSSLTMVLSIAALERAKRRASFGFLATTVLLGLVFLVNKAFEWGHKIEHGIYPMSDKLLEHTNGENIFYGLYYGMTGLHALHVIAGLVVLVTIWHILARRTCRLDAQGVEEEEIGRRLFADEGNKLESAGLYWHLVDIIWIFLFPLFYLIS